MKVRKYRVRPSLLVDHSITSYLPHNTSEGRKYTKTIKINFATKKRSSTDVKNNGSTVSDVKAAQRPNQDNMEQRSLETIPSVSNRKPTTYPKSCVTAPQRLGTLTGPSVSSPEPKQRHLLGDSRIVPLIQRPPSLSTPQDVSPEPFAFRDQKASRGVNGKAKPESSTLLTFSDWPNATLDTKEKSFDARHLEEQEEPSVERNDAGTDYVAKLYPHPRREKQADGQHQGLEARFSSEQHRLLSTGELKFPTAPNLDDNEEEEEDEEGASGSEGRVTPKTLASDSAAPPSPLDPSTLISKYKQGIAHLGLTYQTTSRSLLRQLRNLNLGREKWWPKAEPVVADTISVDSNSPVPVTQASSSLELLQKYRADSLDTTPSVLNENTPPRLPVPNPISAKLPPRYAKKSNRRLLVSSRRLANMTFIENVPNFSWRLRYFQRRNQEKPPLPPLETVVTKWGIYWWGYELAEIAPFFINSIEGFNLLRSLNIALPERLQSYFRAIAGAYHADNPYHNFFHCIQVYHVAWLLLSRYGFAQYLKPVEILGTLLGALCHDVDHPGLNNDFLIAIQHPTALLYNDVSVLENHHCAFSFRIFDAYPGYDFREGMSESDRRTLRRTFIRGVLATDMQTHSVKLGNFSNRVQRHDLGAELLSCSNTEDRNLVVEMVLHAADISNPITPKPYFRHWASLIVEEFNLQCDRESMLGLEPTAFMNCRTEKARIDCQIGFIEFIVLPVWKTMALVAPELNAVVKQGEDNASYWHRSAKAYASSEPSTCHKKRIPCNFTFRSALFRHLHPSSIINSPGIGLGQLQPTAFKRMD